MSLSSAATFEVIPVLIADSNRMQAQLLTSALRRHPDFLVSHCLMDTASILQAMTSNPPRVALLCPSPPASIAETVMTLHRRPRHIHDHRFQPPPAMQMPDARGSGANLGQHQTAQLPGRPDL